MFDSIAQEAEPKVQRRRAVAERLPESAATFVRPLFYVAEGKQIRMIKQKTKLGQEKL